MTPHQPERHAGPMSIWASRNAGESRIELWCAPPQWSHRHQHWTGSIADWLANGFCPDGFEAHTGVRIGPGQCFELSINATIVAEVGHDD